MTKLIVHRTCGLVSEIGLIVPLVRFLLRRVVYGMFTFGNKELFGPKVHTPYS